MSKPRPVQPGPNVRGKLPPYPVGAMTAGGSLDAVFGEPPAVSPVREWSAHWLDCRDCILGMTPEQDEFCPTGARLHEDALEDQRRRSAGLRRSR